MYSLILTSACVFKLFSSFNLKLRNILLGDGDNALTLNVNLTLSLNFVGIGYEKLFNISTNSLSWSETDKNNLSLSFWRVDKWV